MTWTEIIVAHRGGHRYGDLRSLFLRTNSLILAQISLLINVGNFVVNAPKMQLPVCIWLVAA